MNRSVTFAAEIAGAVVLLCGIMLLAVIGLSGRSRAGVAPAEAAAPEDMSSQTATHQEPAPPPLREEADAEGGRRIVELREAAQKGDLEAQNVLGNGYFLGRGVKRDYAMALRWYRVAAEAGHPEAQNNLGRMYLKGYGVEPDQAQAMTWCRKAADQGLASAQYVVGLMYARGDGVAVDQGQANVWWRQAAAQKHAWAMFKLGEQYEKGLGVEKNLDNALAWYRQAAERNLPQAVEKVNAYGGASPAAPDSPVTE